MKHYALITRDFTQVITMGPLIVAPLGIKQFGTQEIAPAHEIKLQRKAGTTLQFATKKARDAWLKIAIADHGDVATIA
jgi:hypothetical protein